MNTLDLTGKIILIAEDEHINYLFLEETLSQTKATIIWAKNGEEAVQVVKNQHVDLILMDIKMPKKDGYEATIEIKKIKDIPIIAQTAYAMSDEKHKILQAGCNEYIAKPIRQQILFETIKKYL